MNKFLTISLIAVVILVSLTIILSLKKNQDNQIITKAGNDMKLSVKNPYKAPALKGLKAWINSEALNLEDLKGKVVLIDFWTYSCINCIRTLPHVTEWHEKYKDDGLVIIGIHTPEFAFEKNLANVKQAVEEYNINYPVALDNDYETWRSYDNRYWPAHYFIDKNGQVRHTHFGEGSYSESEEIIRYLLSEGRENMDFEAEVSKESDLPPVRQGQTPETYLGYSRIQYFANLLEIRHGKTFDYTLASNLKKHYWNLVGPWQVGTENSVSQSDNSQLRLRFAAKEVYLVMGSDREVEIRIKLNGQEQEPVKVGQSKLYTVVKSDKFLEDALLELTIPAGVSLNAFTFGS